MADALLTNFIEGTNPFNLARPSPWWLQLLWDYDPELVVIPSCREHAYRLCRRAPREKRMGLRAVGKLHQHPDTIQMINHGLLPVATLTTWSVSSDKIIRDLMARDTWRMGGAEKVDDMINAQERASVEQTERRQQQELLYRSGDAFRSLQTQKGERVSLADVNRGRGPVRAGKIVLA